MSKKSKIDFLHKLFFALQRGNVGNRGFYTDWTRYCDQIEKSEREHRKFAPDGIRLGLSVPDATKLFAVKYLAEFRAGKFTYESSNGHQVQHRPRKWLVKDIFSIRLECYYAQALWETNAPEIREAISLGDSRKFLTEIDYCDLIK